MTTYLALDQVLEIQAETIRLHGGSTGLLDLGLVESAVAQPRMTFGGVDLYPTLVEKAAALGFTLTSNHGFRDGNKRVGFAALDVFLRLNGFKIVAQVDEAELISLGVAAHTVSRGEYTEWVRRRIVPLTPRPEGDAE